MKSKIWHDWKEYRRSHRSNISMTSFLLKEYAAWKELANSLLWFMLSLMIAFLVWGILVECNVIKFY